ncbi:putative amidoligase enzyme-domain-containing protein [Hypomontagnella monticulosa]|nr:putative amidoligase enzyme-domain-containing protein [Hypomontagnella monticulosa]
MADEQEICPVSKYEAIIESPDDSTGPLTFGIELEFLVAFLDWEPDPHPQEERRLLRAEDRLSAPRSAIDHELLHVLEPSHNVSCRLESSDTHCGTQGVLIQYNQWRIDGDGSLSTDDYFAGYRFLGREITSEVMRADEPIAYTEKITDVCRAIRQMRVHINETAGMHVHVGRGEESFSLLTMKKLATIIWLTEKMLLGLHHPSRKESIYCILLRDESLLRIKAADTNSISNNILRIAREERMDEFIPRPASLEATKTIEELAGLMSAPDNPDLSRGAMSFTRFLPAAPGVGNIHTIEFRQMAGSLDPGPIIHWAKVCMAIVDFARLSTAPRYKELIARIIEEEATFTGLDLLSELDLPEEEQYFRGKMMDYSRGNLEFYEGERPGCPFLSTLE